SSLREAKRLAPLGQGSHKLVQAMYTGLTTLLERTGRASDASKWLQEVIKVHPNDPDLLNEMGNVASTSGNYMEAENYYRKAVQQDPNHLGAHKNLGLVYYSMGRIPEAIHEYETVVHLSPYEAKMLNNLGILYEKVSNKSRAKECWEMAL